MILPIDSITKIKQKNDILFLKIAIVRVGEHGETGKIFVKQ